MTGKRLREIADKLNLNAGWRPTATEMVLYGSELRAYAVWLEQYEKDPAAAQAQPAVLVPRDQLERNAEQSIASHLDAVEQLALVKAKPKPPEAK